MTDTSKYAWITEDLAAKPPAPAGGKYDWISDDIAQQRQAQQARARTVLELALKDDPEIAAERQRLSVTSGVPLRVVERNLDELRIKERARMVDLARMAQESPVLYRQLVDPTFTTVAQDDLPVLTQIERAINGAFRYATSGDMNRSLAGDTVRASQDVLAGATMGLGEGIFNLTGALYDLVGWDSGARDMRYYANRSREARQQFGLQPESSTGQAVKAGLGSAGTNLALLPAGLSRGLFQTAEAASVAVAGAQGAMVGADAYFQGREARLGKGQSTVFGLTQGGFEFLFEKIPAQKLFGDIALNETFVRTLGKQLGIESVTEQATTLAQDFNEWMNLNPEKSVGQFLAERPEAAYQTFIATLVGVGVQTSTIQGINKIVEKMSDQALVFEQDRFDEMMKAAGQSMLRQRSPEQFRAHVQRVLDEGADSGASKEVYVDAEVLAQLPPDVLAQLPARVQEQIPAALEAGSTVAIPMADVLTVAPGTALEQTLNDFARLRPDAPTRAEAQQAADVLKQDAERILQQAQDQAAAQQEFDAVRMDLAQQIAAAGRYRPAVAEAYAAGLAHFFVAYGARTGLGTKGLYEAYKSRGFAIRGQASTQGAALEAGKPGEISVVGYHFSTQDRPVLSTAFYGTGLKGSARDQIMSSPDARLRQRLSFYFDKGTGVRPESGVGGRAHRVSLTGVYDADADPLKLRTADARTFESKLLDLGYRGYATRMEGTQPGQVIMLGQQTFQPELLGPQTSITSDQVLEPIQREPQWQTQASGTPEQLQARMERMQANPAWQNYEIRIEGNELQVRELAGVLEQSGREGGDTTYAETARRLLDEMDPPVLSTVAIVDGKEDAPRFRNITELAAFFTKRNRVKARDLDNPRTQAKIADALFAEALHGLTDAGNAIGWYDRKTKAALQIIADVHPELNIDEEARFAFIAMLAVTSNGLRSRDNFVIAERLYREQWKTTRRFPESVPDGGPRTNQMGEALALLNRKIDELGWQAVRDFMSAKHTAKQVRDFAGAANFFGEQAAAPVPGALFLGPKLGSFFNNLYGDFSTVTMDRWFMRTVNRIRGRMLSLPASFTKNLGSLREQIQSGVDTFGVKADKILAEIAAYEQAPIEQQQDVLYARSKLRAVQHYVRARHRDFARPKDDGTGKKRTFFERTPENYLAKNIDLSLSGSNDAPSAASDRTWIRGVIDQVQQRFADAGIEISNADLQAVLWYYEKDLYAKLIGRTNEDAQLEEDAEPKEAEDYETAARFAVGRLQRAGVAAGSAGPARPDAVGTGTGAGAGTAGVLAQGDLSGQPQPTGDGAGRYSSGSLAPLAGAPEIVGATGPDAKLVAVAEQYAAEHGIDLRRQGAYVEVDEDRARRIAAAYEAMPHAPNDPRVKEAYDDLIRQTVAQYLALQAAGYKFWFMDPAADPYAGNPWNAMRDLRANQSMAVFPSEAGFGTGGQVNIGLVSPTDGTPIEPAVALAALKAVGAEVEVSAVFDSDTEPTLAVKVKQALTPEQGDQLSRSLGQEAVAQMTDDNKGALFGPAAEKWGPFNLSYFVTPTGQRGDEVANPLLQDTGITWAYGSPDGEQRPVLANDLFRAVHDAFGHGLEGAGFRARGEENAWQAHVRLFTGPAVGAITSETRGQNSWLNYGPHGEANQTAKVEDTVFADQKTGLMPSWTWEEGRAPDADSGVLEQRAADPTQTPEFKSWFGDIAKVRRSVGGAPVYLEPVSHVVDSQGKPRVVYHATNTSFDVFETGRQTFNSTGTQNDETTRHAIFMAESQGFAKQFLRSEDGAQVMELYASIKSPVDLTSGLPKSVIAEILAEDKTLRATDFKGYSATTTWQLFDGELGRKTVAALQAAGYDGALLTEESHSNPDHKERVWVAFHPEQIKSATGNDGSFDANDPSILSQQARGTFNPRTLELVLGPDSDLSTLWHEMGHFFLEVLADVATQPNAPAQIAGDYAAVLGWFGVTPEQWKGFTLDQKRNYHEQWARAVEAYVIEGKVPNAELAPLMRRFSAWLKAVYGSIKQMIAGLAPEQRPEINDDIRRVMDRMLATDEQIAQANEVAGLTPDEVADAEANDRLRKRSMADLKWTVKARDKVIRELQKKAAGIRKEIEAEVTVEANQTPEMRAKAALDALQITPEYQGILDTWKAERETAAADERARLVAELYAANPDAVGLKKGQLLAKNKREIANKVDAFLIGWDRANLKPARPVNMNDADMATVADSFGYPSVEAMLEAIANFGSKQDYIDGRTEQRMLEEHGDLMNEEAIKEAANEAVHNEARARSLASELRSQAEMLNTRTDTGETNAKGSKVTVSSLMLAAKQFGENVVGRTTLRDLKSVIWQHTAAERRAAKKWQEATAAGKTEEAVRAKQDQVLNNAAARAALDAKAEGEKMLAFFARVLKGNDETVVEKGRDPDIVNAARAVLQLYGLQSPASKGAAAYLEALRRNDPDTWASVEPMAAAASANAQPVLSLTFDELVGLHEQIQAMWFLAKRSRQMEVGGDLMDIDDLADDLLDRLEEIGIPDRIPGEGGAVTKAEERGLFLKQGIAFLRRVEQWAEGIDGKYGGPFLRYVFQPVKDAADRYRKDRIAYRKQFQALVDKLSPIVGNSVIDAPELGYTFGAPGSSAGTAMNEILHALLHTGNESNKRKMLVGRGWAVEGPNGELDTSKWDAFIARLVNEGKLEKGHYDFLQGVWDLMESTKPLAQKTHRDVFGRYFAEVTAEPFVDPFGIPRSGGYVPAQVDPRLVKDNALKKLAEEENNSMAFAFPQPAKGFTMSRVEGYNRPLMLDLRTLSQHLDKVLLFAHMTPATRGVRKLITHKKVGGNLDRVQPAAIETMLQPWLQRSAQQIVETPVVGAGKWARIPGVIRARAGMALMFANVSNTLQQITGLSTAAVRVKPAHLMRALAQYVAAPREFSKAVWDLSPYMDDRATNEVAIMNEQMQDILIRPGVYQRAQSWSMRHAYFLQTAFDNVLSPIVWTGAYNQALAEGMNDADAIKFADGTVRQTQGSTLPEDVSRLETGPAYARVFTQFVGYFNMMANTNATAIKQIADEVGLKKGAGKALYVVLMGLMVPIWVAEAIAQAFKGGPDDEDKDGQLVDDWLAAVFGFGTAKGLLAQVPIAGQVAVAGMNRMNGNPLDDRISLSPAVSLLEASVGAPESVYKAIAEDGSKQKAIRDVATLVSVATGIPVYAAARPLGYAAGVADNRIDPTSPVDLTRGLVTGTASPESKQR